MELTDLISSVFILSGGFFFFAGTVGLLRFPDLYTRLHALTKADNLGLGLIVIGLLMQSRDLIDALQLLLVWVFILVTSATACYLIASVALRGGVRPWRKP